MPINFPDSPTNGDTHTVGDKTWTYNGTSWDVVIASDGVAVIRDADNDTKIQVEEGSDDDTIRFDTAGSERMTIGSTGAVSVAGNLTVDTNTLHVDAASDRVGIGTTGPGYKLDVNGTAAFSNAVVSGEVNTGSLVVDTNTLYVDATNNRIGVGTTSPAHALDVVGSVNASQSVTIGDGGQIVAGSIYSDGNWGMILRAKRANPAIADFRFANSADVARMIIDTAGRVTTPSQPAFAVYHNGSADVTYTGIVDFNTKKFDTGNNFNLTTDTFTAPVSGVYQFNWTSYTNATAGTGGYRTSIFINGAQAMMNGHWGAAHNILTGTFYLNANDAVTLRAVSGFVVTFYGTEGHNLFSGFLVG